MGQDKDSMPEFARMQVNRLDGILQVEAEGESGHEST
jgi:hypothetical protein